jgi:hypothetical protein
MTTLAAELEAAVRIIKRVVSAAVPGAVTGDEALSLVALFAEAERSASSGVARLTPVVTETGSYAKSGHGTAADWLAAVSGSSTGAAKGRLAAAERAAANPELADAVRHSDLSASQLKLVTDAAAVSPDAVGTLLPMVAEQVSFKQLSDSAARSRAAIRSRESERQRRQRVHALRHLCWHQDELGGIRGEFLCDETAWARVHPLLEAQAKERWRAAGGSGSTSGDSLDAHRLDVFLDFIAGSGRKGSGARPHTLVIVDAEALRRGTNKGGEICEIDGVGPVSVEAVTELIGDGGMQFLVRDGVDIRIVTKTTRVLARRAQMALVARDRICAVPTCGKRLGLQQDHWDIDFGKGGPTELAKVTSS